MAEGRRHPHELIPLCPAEPQSDGALEDRVETARGLGTVQFLARLLTDCEAWHQAIPQPMTQPKALLRLAVLIDTMVLRAANRTVGHESIQDLNGVAEGTRTHVGVPHAVWVGNVRRHGQGGIVRAEGARSARAEEGTRLQPAALPIGR